MNISIFDCTLRDGGCVNDFEFSSELMSSVEQAVFLGGAEYVELGYLDSKKGTSSGTSCFRDMDSFIRTFSPRSSDNKCTRFLMIDQGKYDPRDLPERSSDTSDGIRICFRKDKTAEALETASIIVSKGYELFIQPMIVTRYSDEELAELIRLFEEKVPEYGAFYIVDSFGELDEADVCSKVLLADKYIGSGKKIGIHTHNSRGLCFEHARKVSKLPLSHDLIIDSTLRGMGKGAGNLPTEDIARYLCDEFNMGYKTDVFIKTSDRYIAPYQEMFDWRDSEEYRLSAKYSVSPTYIKNICERYETDMDILEQIIAAIPSDKKDSFDSAFAGDLCDRFFSLRRVE